MTTKDRALREIELSAASVVDNSVLLHCHATLLGQEGLAPIVDEDVDARIVGEDHVTRFGSVNHDIRVVNEVDIGTEPGIRQIPRRNVIKADGDKGASREDLAKLSIFFIQNGFALCKVLCDAFRYGHGGHPVLGLIDNRFDVSLVLNGLVCQLIQHLTNAAIIVGWIVPAIDAINGVQPEGHLLLGKEVAKDLQSRTALHVDRIAIRRPVILGGRMVINALHGESASLQPLLALAEIKAYIDHEDVRILDLSHGRDARTRRRNGVHLDSAVL